MKQTLNKEYAGSDQHRLTELNKLIEDGINSGPSEPLDFGDILDEITSDQVCIAVSQ